MAYGAGGNRIPRESLRISEPRPGWLSASEHLPVIGELVQCAEGMAEVVRIAGRTGDGSLLLELALPDRPVRHPFFAAASNVLVAPRPA
jgi:hypothetical protein